MPSSKFEDRPIIQKGFDKKKNRSERNVDPKPFWYKHKNSIFTDPVNYNIKSQFLEKASRRKRGFRKNV